jgi:hypothetical protein
VATKVQIFNRAARAAGETQRIADVEETGLVPTTLADVYDDFLREVLEARDWPWARAKVALSPSAETRVGWDFTFTLPTDCVRPLALLYEGERRELIPTKERTPFEVVPNDAHNGYLLCAADDEFEVLEYIAFIDSPALYPPHFVEAFVLRLAAHLLDAVKKAPAEALAMMARYENAVAVAHAVANNAAGVPAYLDPPGITARG